MAKKICVVIPSYKTKDLTCRLVDQCFNFITTNSDTTKEIIVVENASGDGTLEALHDKWKGSANFHLIVNKENLGFSKAINQGLKKGMELNSDNFILINTDVELKNPEAFTIMSDVLDKYRSFGCLLPDNAVIGKDQEERKIWFSDNIGVCRDEGMWYCIGIPKRTIEEIGYLDEQFFLHCSDSEYATRLRYHGFKVGLVRLSLLQTQHKGFTASRFLPDIHKVVHRDRDSWSKLKATNYFTDMEAMNKVKEPFLSIITRHWIRRPNFMKVCQESLSKVVPLTDVEHLVILDDTEKGRGLDWAGKSLGVYKYNMRIKGTYVLILDDDNMITNPDITKIFREEALKNNYPDCFIFKCLINDKQYPPQHVWNKKKLAQCQIGSFCYAVKTEHFYRFAETFGVHHILGDFKFIKRFEQEKLRIHWIDAMMCKTQRESHGKPE